MLVNVWTTPGSQYEFYRSGYTVTLQKPDGTTDVIGPFNSYLGDCTAWFNYAVNEVGTWSIKFDFAGTYIPAGSYVTLPGQESEYPNFTLGASIYWEPSSTSWQNFTVQTALVAGWPSVPLPTNYWTRPISSEMREWYVIAGNYPWTGAYYYPDGQRVLYSSNYQYTPYVQAPNTAHILWSREGAIGGLIGGDTYENSLNTGGGNPSIIFDGRCYQAITKPMMQLVNGTLQSVATSVLECYDLQTGQVYWDLTNVPTPTNILYEAPVAPTSLAIPGAEASLTYTVYLAALSGNRLIKYDPYTGTVSVNISIPTFTQTIIYNNEWVLSLQTIVSGTTNRTACLIGPCKQALLTSCKNI